MRTPVTPVDPQVVERMQECIREYIRSCPLGSANPARLQMAVFLGTPGATQEAWLRARLIARLLENGRAVLV